MHQEDWPNKSISSWAAGGQCEMRLMAMHRRALPVEMTSAQTGARFLTYTWDIVVFLRAIVFFVTFPFPRASAADVGKREWSWSDFASLLGKPVHALPSRFLWVKILASLSCFSFFCLFASSFCATSKRQPIKVWICPLNERVVYTLSPFSLHVTELKEHSNILLSESTDTISQTFIQSAAIARAWVSCYLQIFVCFCLFTTRASRITSLQGWLFHWTIQ